MITDKTSYEARQMAYNASELGAVLRYSRKSKALNLLGVAP